MTHRKIEAGGAEKLLVQDDTLGIHGLDRNLGLLSSLNSTLVRAGAWECPGVFCTLLPRNASLTS